MKVVRKVAMLDVNGSATMMWRGGPAARQGIEEGEITGKAIHTQCRGGRDDPGELGIEQHPRPSTEIPA